MSVPKRLESWDWHETEWVPDGYDEKQVPVMSDDNFRLLAEKVNEIIDYLDYLEVLKEKS